MATRKYHRRFLPGKEPDAFELPLNLWSPDRAKYLPTQANFIQDWGTRFRAYGGGLGNGKTTGGCALAYFLSVCFPGNCGYIGRWDGKELVQTTMAEFFRIIPMDMFEVQNKQMGYLRFKREYGGSEIYYGDLKKEEWASSLNLGWFWFDQAEETDEARWNHGVSRLRRMVPLLDEDGTPIKHPDGTEMLAPTYGFATFNPEGTHSFLWRFFHPDSPDRQPDYALYQATTYDGLAAGFVRQDYVDAMLSVYPEAAQKRYLEGSWDVFEGKVFANFDPKVHVIDPLPLSASWQYYVSIDHGLKNPTSAGIWAITPDGVKIRIREHYEGNGKPISYHAACIKNLVSDLPVKPALMIMDPACWAGTQSKDNRVLSVVDEYHEHGIYPVPGHNEWQRTYNLLNEALAFDPSARHPVTGEQGSPRLLTVRSCNNFIREMSNYKWKKARGTVLRNAPDEPIDYNDHCVAGDTLVAMPSGYARIKDLVGTQPWVYAYDHQAKKLTVAQASWVAKTGVQREIWKLTHDSGALYATPDHLIMRRGGTYTKLAELKYNDFLMPFTRNLFNSGVTSIVPLRVLTIEPYGVEDVYDMQVDPHHNFVANGIVIHNSIDETRYFLSLAPSVVRHESVAAPLTGLERIATLRAKWNPLGGSFEHPGSWMTT